MLIAEYTVRTKRFPATLDLNVLIDGRRTNFTTFSVANKREARALATRYGAEPWNF